MVQRKVKERKEGHVKFVREKFIEQKDSKNFHKSKSTIMRGSEQELWNIRHLFPGMEDQTIANTAADFFSEIGRSSTPLQDSQIPNTYADGNLALTVSEVETKLRKCK